MLPGFAEGGILRPGLQHRPAASRTGPGPALVQIHNQFVLAETVEADDLMICATRAVDDQSAAAFPGEGYRDRIRGLVAGHEAFRFRDPGTPSLGRTLIHANCMG